MILVRRHLRRGVVAWLVCHVLTFTALVPRDCCAAHAHGRVTTPSASTPGGAAASATAEPPCHEAAAAVAPAPAAEGDHCDMPHADGAACPMHRGGAAGAAGCRLSGVCHAPDAALAAVLWQAAVAPAAPIVPAPAVATVDRVVVAPSSRALVLPPDSPPPRL